MPGNAQDVEKLVSTHPIVLLGWQHSLFGGRRGFQNEGTEQKKPSVTHTEGRFPAPLLWERVIVISGWKAQKTLLRRFSGTNLEIKHYHINWGTCLKSFFSQGPDKLALALLTVSPGTNRPALFPLRPSSSDSWLHLFFRGICKFALVQKDITVTLSKATEDGLWIL